MNIQHFFDADTSTFSYIVSDPATKHCALIDSVLNFDMPSGKTSTNSADQLIQYVEEHELTVEWILETHAHADHLTAAPYLKEKLGGKIGIGEHIKDVLDFWVPLLNVKATVPTDGTQFDHLFKEGEIFTIGSIEVTVMHTPGHTPACLSYLMGDCVFVGDTLFMPYVGTARTDFPGGSAKTLYHSIQKLLALPDETKIYTCHDYPPEGKPVGFLSTVAEQKKSNSMIHEGISEQDYIKARNAKDEGKPVPKLLIPSLQVNIRSGTLPDPEDNGTQYLKLPLNKLS